jgi:hypothetical protein
MPARIFSRFGLPTVEERFSYVLRGRAASPWGRWVGLSQGTLSRLKGGALPDPVKLTATCRAENLSLTWLLDGLGAPYLVTPVTDTDEARRYVRMLRDEEPDWHVLLVDSGPRSLVVLHQPAEVDTPQGPCAYQAVSVLAGDYQAVAAALAGGAGLRRLEVDPEGWLRLASGYMGSTELFGWPGDPGGLFTQSIAAPIEPLLEAGRFSDAAVLSESPEPAYAAGSARGEEILQILEELDDEERGVVVRMLSGLRRFPAV